MPTYKDQQANIADKDLSTYGFLGYPVLQTADVLIYRAGKVPVGGDQVAHLELAREIARRFNFIFGREPQFEAHAENAIGKNGQEGGTAVPPGPDRVPRAGRHRSAATRASVARRRSRTCPSATASACKAT